MVLALLLVATVGVAGGPGLSVAIVSPANGPTVSGPITFEAGSTGSITPRYVDFQIDGTTRWREWYAPYVFNGDGNKLDTRTLADGAHALRVVAVDSHGHIATASVTITVASGLPSISIPSPTANTTVSGIATWQTNVSGPTVSKVDYLIDGALKWTELTAPYYYGGDPGRFDTRTLGNGTHTLVNRATTSDGRTVSTSVSISVSNTVAPTVTPPSVTTAPAVSGTAVVGATLTTTTGSWSGSTPLTYSTEWQRCSSATSCATVGSGTSYSVVSADVGSMLRSSVKATNSAGSATSTSALTATVTNGASTPDPGTTSRSFTGWGDSLRAAFVAKRTVVVTSTEQFAAAWKGLQPGDLIDVRGVTFTGQLELWNKALSDWAEVRFDSATKMMGGGTPGYFAVSVADLSHVRIYGGDVTNSNGHGFRVEDSSDVVWWGFRAHDTAGGCGAAFGIAKPVEKVDLRGEVWNCGKDLSLDPHTEKGTGLHGFYLGGGSYRTSGTFIIKAHDLPTGAAIQIGPRTQDSIIEVDARRLTMVARQQVAGNALQWWGGDLRNITVRYAYGEDLAGRVSETDGMYSGNVAGAITVGYARSAGTIRLSPKYAPMTDGSVVYGDCS